MSVEQLPLAGFESEYFRNSEIHRNAFGLALHLGDNMMDIYQVGNTAIGALMEYLECVFATRLEEAGALCIYFIYILGALHAVARWPENRCG